MSGVRCLALLVLAGCPEVAQEEWAPQEIIDEGDVCATRDAAGDVEFRVVWGCLSSSCSRNPVGTCTATFDGTHILLTSEFSFETSDGRQGCTTDCGSIMATCTVGGVSDGTYDVDFGDDVVSVTLPNPEC